MRLRGRSVCPVLPIFLPLRHFSLRSKCHLPLKWEAGGAYAVSYLCEAADGSETFEGSIRSIRLLLFVLRGDQFPDYSVDIKANALEIGVNFAIGDP